MKSPLRSRLGTGDLQAERDAELKNVSGERTNEVMIPSPWLQNTELAETKRLAAFDDPVALRQRLQ